MLSWVEPVQARRADSHGLAATSQGALMACRIDAKRKSTGDRDPRADEVLSELAGPVAAGAGRLARANHRQLE